MSEIEAEQAKEGDGEDQSMEEILQSIRRIITEDEKEEAAEERNAAAQEPDNKDNGELADIDELLAVGDGKDMAGEESADSDILELTEIVEETEGESEDKSSEGNAPVPLEELAEQITDASDAETLPKVQAQPASLKDKNDGVLSEIDEALGSNITEIKPEEHDSDRLISEDTAAAASALLQQVKRAPASKNNMSSLPAMRSGTTLEDLMIEAMRPMLKEWLDEYLPSVVEGVVQNEVKKLAN